MSGDNIYRTAKTGRVPEPVVPIGTTQKRHTQKYIPAAGHRKHRNLSLRDASRRPYRRLSGSCCLFFLAEDGMIDVRTQWERSLSPDTTDPLPSGFCAPGVLRSKWAAVFDPSQYFFRHEEEVRDPPSTTARHVRNANLCTTMWHAATSKTGVLHCVPGSPDLVCPLDGS